MSLKKEWQSFARKYLTQRAISTPPVLLFWWGSYGYKGGATLGDLMAVNNLSSRLNKAGVEHAVVSHSELKLSGHLLVDNIYSIKPARKVVFVCGPITHNRNLKDLFSIHRGARKIAAGVSVLANHAKMNSQFHHIIGRDGMDPSYFDLAVSEAVAPPEDRPLRTVGVCLRGPQGEYGAKRKGMAAQAQSVFQDVLRKYELRPVEIDTVLSPQNSAETIQRKFIDVDFVLTTRMHGALLSLAAGKPVIAIDQVPGGAKVSAVVGKTGWPFIFRSEVVSADKLHAVIDRLRTDGWTDLVLTSQAKMRDLSNQALNASVEAIAT